MGSLQPNLNKNQQQIIVIPQSMLVNGCISAKDLKSIIGEKNNANNSQTQLSSPNSQQNCIKTMENRGNLKDHPWPLQTVATNLTAKQAVITRDPVKNQYEKGPI